MIDIELEAKEIEEGQSAKEEPEEEIKPAEIEGISFFIGYQRELTTCYYCSDRRREGRC